MYVCVNYIHISYRLWLNTTVYNKIATILIYNYCMFMSNNVKSLYWNICKYWLQLWDFWPAYRVVSRYFATSTMKEIFMFCNIQSKWRFRLKYLKLNVTTENCYLTAVGVWVWVWVCGRARAHIYIHTHSWPYITLGITQITLCPVPNIPEEMMFQILDLFLLSGKRMERHLLNWVWLSEPITITVHPTSDTSTYICTYDHNSWWYRFGYLPQTKLDRMCTQTCSFVTWIAQWLD